MSGKVVNTIIKDGLVYCMDAANSKSYMNGTTKVYDLTTNNNNIDFYASPTFDTGNGGSFTFNGANSIMANTTNTILNVGAGGNVTIEAFFKTTTTSTFQPIITYGAVGTSPTSINYGIAILNNDRLGYIVGNGGTSVGSTTISTNQWYGATLIFNNTTNIGYQNGIQIGTFSQPTLTTSATILSIGAAPSTLSSLVYKFTGNIACARIYNRALSAAEVLQNYNATKGRFGL